MMQTALMQTFVGLGCVVVVAGCGTRDVDTPQRVASDWVLVWADEFDGAAGDKPDPAKWGYDIGVGQDGWGNQELQYYTDSADNASMDGEGNLVITARQEAVQGSSYTSARMLTQEKFSVLYGRIEARVKLPRGAGLWPAFWMLGENFPTVGWPYCGEIDIMEYQGQVPDVVHGSLHGPGYSGGSPITDVYFLPDGETFDSDFHVFAVEWSPGRIAWFVDDVAYTVATTGQVPSGSAWVYDHPFFLILNMAVGGTFVGPPNAATPFPAAMLVDYVRVYTRQEAE